MRFLLIAALFLGCAPAPATLKRGTFTPPPPAPVRPGVGAPSVGQPGQARPELPRSPHKRVLPPTAGPGVWAGDEPKASKRDKPNPSVLGFSLPDPKDAQAPGYTAGYCASAYNDIIDQNEIRAKGESLSRSVRACMVAKLYDHCIDVLLAEYAKKQQTGEFTNFRFRKELERHKQFTSEHAKQMCSGGDPWSPDATHIFDGLRATLSRSQAGAK